MKRNLTWRNILFLLLCFVLFFKLKAQNEAFKPNPIPKSPHTASLGKYGDYPVSLFTGIPEISIPLYEIKSGEISIPVTLSYHASGIKYSDLSTFVGLGWSLNTGGVVSRQVKGSADESEKGFLFDSQYKLNPTPCNDHSYLQNLSNGTSDGTPDIFSYSLNGKNGKFVLQRNDQPVILIPYAPVSVKPDITTPHINFFEITDEDGMLYRFGQSRDNVQYGENSGGNEQTSWLLTEIEAPNSNDRISYTYTDGGAVQTSSAYDYRTIKDNCSFIYTGGIDGMTPEELRNLDVNYRPDFGILYTVAQGQKIYQSVPKEIFFEKGKIVFSYTGLKLDQLLIYSYSNNTYTLIKTVQFVYTYFKNRFRTMNLRLKLDNIYVLDQSNTIQEKYSFDYFTDTFSWDVPINSKSIDYWGFYNGEANTSYIPYANIGFNGETTNIGSTNPNGKKASPTYMKEGVLKRITFPTGGYTEFDFETNKYKENDGSTFFAGGLRVTQIKSYVGINSLPLTKTYKYGYRESGYGQRNFLLNTGVYVTGTHTLDISPALRGEYNQRTYYSAPQTDILAWDASIVVYPHVTEYFGDTTDNIGKILYEFDNGTPPHDGAVTNTYGMSNAGKFFWDSYYWQRGKLTQKKVFDKSGNLLTKTVNNYRTIRMDRPIVGLVGWRAEIRNYGYYYPNHCPNDPEVGIDEYNSATQQLLTGINKLVRTDEFVFQKGDTTKYFSTFSTYKYDSLKHYQLIETRQSSATPGEEIVTKMKYPLDYGSSSTLMGGLKMLVDKNMLNKVIEKYTVRQKTDGTNAKVISGMLTTFSPNPYNTAQVVADTIYIWESNPFALSSFQVSSQLPGTTWVKKDSHYKPRLKFVKYSAEGNIEEYAMMDGRAVLDNTRTSYIWGYNKALPVAETANASSLQAAYAGFESDEKGGWEYFLSNVTSSDAKTGKRSCTSQSFTKSVPSGDYTVSFWAKGTGSISVNGNPKNISSSWSYYEWVLNGATTITVSNTGGLMVDDLRVFPTSTRMTTYTFDPLFGIRTVSDSNNITSYFDYDDHGRLHSIKDQDVNILKKYDYNYQIK